MCAFFMTYYNNLRIPLWIPNQMKIIETITSVYEKAERKEAKKKCRRVMKNNK